MSVFRSLSRLSCSYGQWGHTHTLHCGACSFETTKEPAAKMLMDTYFSAHTKKKYRAQSDLLGALSFTPQGNARRLRSIYTIAPSNIQFSGKLNKGNIACPNCGSTNQWQPGRK
jgi:hypothetical protein